MLGRAPQIRSQACACFNPVFNRESHKRHQNHASAHRTAVGDSIWSSGRDGVLKIERSPVPTHCESQGVVDFIIAVPEASPSHNKSR